MGFNSTFKGLKYIFLNKYATAGLRKNFKFSVSSACVFSDVLLTN